jgi:hypothetical protein
MTAPTSFSAACKARRYKFSDFGQLFTDDRQLLFALLARPHQEVYARGQIFLIDKVNPYGIISMVPSAWRAEIG